MAEDKRKRGGSDSSGEFYGHKETKKLNLSPTALMKESTAEEKMEKLMSMLECMQNTMEKQNEVQNNNAKELKEEMQEIRNDLKDLKMKEEKWEQERKQFIDRITNLERELTKIEKHRRRKNIVIKGLTFGDGNIKTKMEEFLRNEIQTQVKLESAFQIGKEPIIVAEFNSMEDKILVMKRKSLLKNKNKKMYIDDDYTKEEQRIQKAIRDRAKTEIANGNKTRVGYRTLWVNAERLVWTDNEDKLVPKN